MINTLECLQIHTLSSQSVRVRLCLLQTLHVCLFACPTVTAHISATIGWILMKLGESIETEIRLIV